MEEGARPRGIDGIGVWDAILAFRGGDTGPHATRYMLLVGEVEDIEAKLRRREPITEDERWLVNLSRLGRQEAA